LKNTHNNHQTAGVGDSQPFCPQCN